MDALKAFAVSTGVDAARFDMEGHMLAHTNVARGIAFCKNPNRDGKECAVQHRRAMENAFRTGEPFVHKCHENAVFAAAAILKNGELAGSICCLPCLMWEDEEDARGMQVVTPMRMRALSEMLFSLAVRLSDGESDALAQGRERTRGQMSVADALEGAKLDDRLIASYPLHMEKELLGRVRIGDRQGARALLNELLGRVFAKSAGRIEITKARLLELVVMISRAAVESGAEMESLFGMNSRYIAELSAAADFEEVCVWGVRALDSFMDAVYRVRNTRAATLLGDAAAYISQHLGDQLTLETVSQAVHISPYYLSHLFKDEMGATFVEFVTKQRVAEAKRRLRGTDDSVTEIAFSLGYVDAGYFIKVFRRATGTTPLQYRKKGQK